MTKDNEYLSAKTSPNTLQSNGVKRVNNLPLFIAIGVLTLFVVVIALVAVKRANNSNEELPKPALKTTHKNMKNLADEVVNNHKAQVQRSFPTPVPSTQEVVSRSLIKKPTRPPSREEMLNDDIPEAELERIRQEKTQAFEEAVSAKTSISFDSTKKAIANNSSKALLGPPGGSGSADVASEFKEQLALLQGMSQKRQQLMPQTLGGSEDEMRWHLKSRLQNPSSHYELRAGGVIPGVMVSGISSELPGQIIGQVSQNVYDTATGRYLLIPQGTKILGLYSSDVAYGQNSVLVAWQRLVFPDGKALDIGSMPGADGAGQAGFRDEVNHHYARIYGSALLMSAIVAGVSYSQNINQQPQVGFAQPTAGSVLSQALGQQLGEVSSELIKKNLNVAPTINIRPGYRFNIIATKDLVFKAPYKQFAY